MSGIRWLRPNHLRRFPRRFALVEAIYSYVIDKKHVERTLLGGAVGYVIRCDDTIKLVDIAEFETPAEFSSTLYDYAMRDKGRTLVVIAYDWLDVADVLQLHETVFQWYGYVVRPRGISSRVFTVELRGRPKVLLMSITNWIRRGSKTWQRGPYRPLGPGLNTNNSIDTKQLARERLLALYDIFQRIVSLLNELDAPFGPTAAAVSLSLFRHRYLEDKVLTVYTLPEYVPLEREAFRGGRLMVLRPGRHRGRFYYVDVNSMYPWIMATQRLPIKPLDKLYNKSGDAVKEYAQSMAVIAKCRIRVNKPLIAKKVSGVTVYPVGRFWAALTTPEIAHDEVEVEECPVVQLYKARAGIFSRWALDLYQRRLRAKREGDYVAADMLKAMLNSLYGKFAQLRRRVEYAGQEDKPAWVWEMRYGPNGEAYEYIQLGRDVYYAEVTTEPWPYSNVALAAHVTAYGRLHIWALAELAGLDHVYYIDTDALIVDVVGYEYLSFNVGDCLGCLSVRHTADEVVLVGLKHYALDNKWVVAGVPLDNVIEEGEGRVKVLKRAIKRHDKWRIYTVVEYKKGVKKEGGLFPGAAIELYEP